MMTDPSVPCVAISPPPAIQDYDLTKAVDWEDLADCCKAAQLTRVVDSQCTPLPPRPPPPPPAPPGAPVVEDDDYCLLQDYDFSKPQDRLYFTACCDDAKAESVRDPDCERPQW
jgi:hypothetical protein